MFNRLEIDIPTPTPVNTPSGMLFDVQIDDTALLYEGAQYAVGMWSGVEATIALELFQAGLIIAMVVIGAGMVIAQLKGRND